MADFAAQKTFADLVAAQATLAAIAKSQGFKVTRCPAPAGSKLEFERVASFHCANASRGCYWHIVLSRKTTEPDQPWTVYNICDQHRGVCRPAVLRRKRQLSESTVETISTDESDLEIPRELRQPRVRSPSLFIPPPPSLKASTAGQGLALPLGGLSLQTSASSNNDEATPDLTPATTNTSNQEKSPTPDAGAFTAYLEDLLRSLDDPAPAAPTEAGSIDPSAMMAAIEQPLSLDLGLPELSGEWRKGATGAHEFLTNMGSEGRKALQPRLERAVSNIQAAVLQPLKVAQSSNRPFADAVETGSSRQKSASPFTFDMALRGYSPASGGKSEEAGEDYGMQLDDGLLAYGGSGASTVGEQSSDDDIPAESLINTNAAFAPRFSNGWSAPRQMSAEQYISPMNLLSPSKDYDMDANDEELEHAPLASTSAAGALMEAIANGETDANVAEDFVIPRDPDGNIDIYAIFDSYKHAEATLLANGERCGLPLRVAWAPGVATPRGEQKRGACLQCVNAGPAGSQTGCEYSVRLSDDSMGKWRLVTSEGEHLASCYAPKHDRKGKGKAKARGRPPKATPASAAPKNKRKKRTSYLGAPGAIDRRLLPKTPGESRFTRTRIDYWKEDRALSPISSKNADPTKSYTRRRTPPSGSDSDGSSSPGVVVQASWRPQQPYRSQNQGSGGSSISPRRLEKLNRSGNSKDEPIDLDDETDSEIRRVPRGRPKPRFADTTEVMEISSAEEDDMPKLPPPLSAARAISQDKAKASPAKGGSAYARKKLPPSPAHRTPTKPFRGANRTRQKPRRSGGPGAGYAWVEEPAFIADVSGSASQSGAAKELAANLLNGGYWRKVDDTGNIVVEKDDGRALRSKRKRGVQTDGVGGKKPVETIVPRRGAHADDEEYALHDSSGDDYHDPGELDQTRVLRASVRRREVQPIRSSRRKARSLGSPGLSFQSHFAFDDDGAYGGTFRGEDYSPPSPAIAASSSKRPYRSRRALAAQDARDAEARAFDIPDKLLGSMSLAAAGFSRTHVMLLARAGYLAVKHLTTEGLFGNKEDFTAFRDQFTRENLREDASKPHIKAVIVRIVWEVRANAILEWEAAGMMESDYEDGGEGEDDEFDAELSMRMQDRSEAPEVELPPMEEQEPPKAESAEPADEDDDFVADQLLPSRQAAVSRSAAMLASAGLASTSDALDLAPSMGTDIDAEVSDVVMADGDTQPIAEQPILEGGGQQSAIADTLTARPVSPRVSVSPMRESTPRGQETAHASSIDSASDSEDNEPNFAPRFVFHDYPAIDTDDSEDEFMQAIREAEA